LEGKYFVTRTCGEETFCAVRGKSADDRADTERSDSGGNHEGGEVCSDVEVVREVEGDAADSSTQSSQSKKH
jgi:hypothetical protein